VVNDNRRLEIAGNLAQVKSKIELACKAAGRDPETVKLIAVSKNFPVSDVEGAISAGQLDFGENRVQELVPKIDALAGHQELNWHLIGTLQRNKVKFVIGRVAMIHSVNTLRLIAQIDRLSTANQCITDVLLQVNISGEDTKFGFDPSELDEAFRQTLQEHPGVRIRGLMTMAPHYDNPDDTLPVFRTANELFSRYREKYDLEDMDQISMGMTHDFRQAIACGSTMIRVGTAIFGARDYSN
jgi:pyridoxal phosphate enzyme (YggS family)